MISDLQTYHLSQTMVSSNRYVGHLRIPWIDSNSKKGRFSSFYRMIVLLRTFVKTLFATLLGDHKNYKDTIMCLWVQSASLLWWSSIGYCCQKLYLREIIIYGTTSTATASSFNPRHPKLQVEPTRSIYMHCVAWMVVDLLWCW